VFFFSFDMFILFDFVGRPLANVSLNHLQADINIHVWNAFLL